jgi:succinate dehydrogenase / fumarate reductase iron-sulfur subunit
MASSKLGKMALRHTAIRIEVSRLDPHSGKFVVKEYSVRMPKYATVLDALLEIKGTQDATLSLRYSCRMGICGSCGMVINGRPVLACQSHLSSYSGKISVGPMLGQPVLRDLVDDFDDFFEKHRRIKPWIIAEKRVKFGSGEGARQSRENVESILPFASCIKCGLCLDACPVVNSNPEFIGPQALAQEHRLMLDSRDSARSERLELVDTKNGIWGCEFIGACSDVCPKGVDPALAIQEMKVEAIKNQIFGLRSGKRSRRARVRGAGGAK